jgi:hypothetical protein
MSGKFCLNAELHVTFRDLLHAVKLRYGTDGFTSPPKKCVLRIFFGLEIRQLRPGLNQETWVPKTSTTEAAVKGHGDWAKYFGVMTTLPVTANIDA